MSDLSKTDFEHLWRRMDAEAQAAKFSQETVLRLADFYELLDGEDRRVVDEILAEWILTGNDRQRFDALAMIDQFTIRSALPALKARLGQLRTASGPSAPTDRAMLQRVISRLRR